MPSLLDKLPQAREIYSDDLAQIQMHTWYANRVVLIGDACQCLTIASAQGASMAVAGGYILATLLNQHRNNIQQAFSDYQFIMQPTILKKQAEARQFLTTFVPDSVTKIMSRPHFLRRFLKSRQETSEIIDFCRNGKG